MSSAPPFFWFRPLLQKSFHRGDRSDFRQIGYVLRQVSAQAADELLFSDHSDRTFTANRKLPFFYDQLSAPVLGSPFLGVVGSNGFLLPVTVGADSRIGDSSGDHDFFHRNVPVE